MGSIKRHDAFFASCRLIVFEDNECYNNLKGTTMQTINLKPNTRLEFIIVNKYFSTDTDISNNIPDVIKLLRRRNPDNKLPHDLLSQTNITKFTPNKKEDVKNTGKGVKKMKFHTLADIRKIINTSSNNPDLMGEYIINFGEHPEDVFTTFDAYPIKDTNNGLRHSIDGLLMSYDKNLMQMKIYPNGYWFQNFIVRYRMGYTNLFTIEDNVTTNDGGRLLPIEPDEEGINLNMFELRKILNLNSINYIEGKSIYDYAVENEQVTLETLFQGILEYMEETEGIDMDIRNFWIQTLLLKYLSTTYLKDKKFSWRLNRKLVETENGGSMKRKDYVIKVEGKFPILENITDEDFSHMVSVFELEGVENNFGLDNKPFYNGHDDYTSVISYLLYMVSMDLYKGGKRGSDLILSFKHLLSK